MPKKGIHTASTSTQMPTDHKVDNNQKGTMVDEDNKEILTDPNDPNKKLKISSKLDPE
jgi:hypothetical protein